MNLTDILISSVSSTALVSILAFLTRNWISERIKQSIKHEYDLKLKEVENKYDREQISLKANFEKEISIYQYKLEQVHPKRIQLIEKLNMDISEINSGIEIYTNILELKSVGTIPNEFSDNEEKLIKKVTEFIGFAQTTKLYLTPKLKESLKLITNLLYDIVKQMVGRQIFGVNNNKEFCAKLMNDNNLIHSEIDNFFNLSKDVINENTT